ncbi:GHMP kinases N terminal domain [Trypanosoma vivax]|uniref:Mevalonate kinase n=1 Tax=Trypanosoma vivax (strain Y486) TaxID=1055687 RepID=G0TZY0_TRYVY|nr:putative mevalonate kinase [Trypanosoma vivax]KAH8617651.1 GHMP kinases N terminal domain [Trypanosoma vivax]CCC50160.1 putative mevalonate kinase [Trypanosoma vivax Y486]
MRRAVKTRTEKSHKGFGKIILFGEHFVVHGAEALVAGICEYTTCALQLLPNKPNVVEVEDLRPAVPGYIAEKREEQRVAHGLVLKHLKIDTSTDGLRITLGGSLVPSSGIGASASDVVALSRALGELYGVQLTEEEVNQSAYAGECGYHGTPSGVDNTAATYGGLISFFREEKRSVFSRIAVAIPLFLVVCSTGITASTSKVVADVARLKSSNPSLFEELVRKYSACVKRAKLALLSGNILELGKLMDVNHALLKELTVSCKELDAIVQSARSCGALGAKMSGTGRGGLVVVLAADARESERIAGELKHQCLEAKFVWQYTVYPLPGKL